MAFLLASNVITRPDLVFTGGDHLEHGIPFGAHAKGAGGVHANTHIVCPEVDSMAAATPPASIIREISRGFNTSIAA